MPLEGHAREEPVFVQGRAGWPEAQHCDLGWGFQPHQHCDLGWGLWVTWYQLYFMRT